MTTIYTDGSCSGNPGPGGWAAIILRDNQPEQVLSGSEDKTTNNRMELTAVIEALKALNLDEVPVLVKADSQYVTNAFNQNWIGNWLKRNWRKSDGKPVENKDLWLTLMDFAKKHRAKFEWLRGHEGDEYNERCDALAKAAISGGYKTQDTNEEFDIYSQW